ncbi:unnamed protein product [Didymodactylos carnosus]|uniref:Uncharacterized protein n=1 Tax=Didymodactylos carnosus TaxID=1234261 RepID=A0A815CXL3_9BILA|nr:unnamed protein product [Didymodactylos carnosus]CAF4095809.1 unnamed protein product [Didymodactylos carnosus]
MFCTLISLMLFICGTFPNLLCITVFLRHKFRSRIITHYFIALLFADIIYFTLRLIKLFYHQKTLFKHYIKDYGKCLSFDSIVKFFGLITQKYHVLFIPFIHFETYIRFSLILMTIVSIQRCIQIEKSMKKIKFVIRKTYSPCIWIFIAFIIAYLFEFFGLTLYCSKENNRYLSYTWFLYTVQNLNNHTKLLTMNMINHTTDYDCTEQYIQHIKSNFSTQLIKNCSSEQISDILGRCKFLFV